MKTPNPKCWCCGNTQENPLKSIPSYKTLSSVAVCDTCFKRTLGGETVEHIKTQAA